jgi:RNA polymerase sigma-70 factor (ECF subfamily)
LSVQEHDVTDNEETVRLLERARTGDQAALDELFTRHLVQLKRWATGRLPRWARSNVDTSDLLQETMLQTFKRLDGFEPRGQGGRCRPTFRIRWR